MQAAVASRPQVTAGTYAGLFVITMSTLMYEILLTRIFSVIMWYHFAFVAISVALFGLTVGALLVYLFPNGFPEDKLKLRMAQASLLFSVSIVLSFLTQLSIPFDPDASLVGIYSVSLMYLATSVPFIFSGICVSLALTKFPDRVGRLYAADLVGAALGAAGLIWLLRVLDGQSAVIAIAAIVAVGALIFAVDAGMRGGARIAVLLAVWLAAFSAGNAAAIEHGHALLRIKYVKGQQEQTNRYEKWNAFSRVQVNGQEDVATRPFGWGLSDTTPDTYRVRQLFIYIDAFAGTPMTYYDGDLTKLDYFKYEVTNLAHNIRPNADVAVLGVGGGRDILSALVFDQQSVRGIELNGAILHTVNGRYGDFTGHLDRDPRVHFVNDEARSYMERSDTKYDIIQMSTTDTFAATSAGAFALSENTLYTINAWETFLDRLKPDGVLTVSRFYWPGEPIETYRLTSLAMETLRRRGVENPRDHLYVVKNSRIVPNWGVQIATMLVSPTPFSAQDLARLDQVSNEMHFDQIVTPTFAEDETFEGLTSLATMDETIDNFEWNISAPTDDSPYFFQLVRLTDLFNGELFGKIGYLDTHTTRPVRLLGILSISVVGLTLLCIILPLVIATRRSALRGSPPFLLFFAAIGLAFLLIEIAQMQRLVIFLGHPTYALSVVLFSLLLASGIGSLVSERLVKVNPHPRPDVIVPLVALLVIVVGFGFLTPAAIDHFESATTPVRILAAGLILMPMGLVMGLPFPIGMRVAATRPESPTVFYWGVNGATSVTASVLAVTIALGWGISAAFWSGVVCYAVAVLSMAFIVMQPRS